MASGSPRFFALYPWCSGHPPGLGKRALPSSKDGTWIPIMEGLQTDEAKGRGEHW